MPVSLHAHSHEDAVSQKHSGPPHVRGSNWKCRALPCPQQHTHKRTTNKPEHTKTTLQLRAARRAACHTPHSALRSRRRRRRERRSARRTVRSQEPRERGPPPSSQTLRGADKALGGRMLRGTTISRCAPRGEVRAAATSITNNCECYHKTAAHWTRSTPH